MQGLKNFIYDKNDILVAVIIICVAALVIFTRIEAIMAYPSELAAAGGKTSQEPADQPKGDGADATSGGGAAKQTTASATGDKQPNKSAKGAVNYSIYIGYGDSIDSIAGSLLNVKLITDKKQFLDAVKASGAESKLQAGTFTIPSGSTPAEIITILTKGR